jgi:type III restriction enzyme
VVLAPDAQIEEVALAKYRDAVVSRLLAAIEPDTNEGEAPILPRIERFRATGSTNDVQFRTTKPTWSTYKSHISHVVLDSVVWEGSAGFHLEQSARVVSYVKNERLDFEIPYEWDRRTVPYRPDFLARIRLDDGREIMLILEMKRMEGEQDRAKYAGAEKWVRAVNNHGGFGTWAFMVCKDPTRLGQMLAGFTVGSAAA